MQSREHIPSDIILKLIVPDNDNDKRLLQYSYVPDYPAAETDDQGAAKEKKRLLQYSYVPDYPAAETDEQGATKEKKRLLQYSYVPDYPAGETQDEEAK